MKLEIIKYFKIICLYLVLLLFFNPLCYAVNITDDMFCDEYALEETNSSGFLCDQEDGLIQVDSDDELVVADLSFMDANLRGTSIYHEQPDSYVPVLQSLSNGAMRGIVKIAEDSTLKVIAASEVVEEYLKDYYPDLKILFFVVPEAYVNAKFPAAKSTIDQGWNLLDYLNAAAKGAARGLVFAPIKCLPMIQTGYGYAVCVAFETLNNVVMEDVSLLAHDLYYLIFADTDSSKEVYFGAKSLYSGKPVNFIKAKMRRDISKKVKESCAT